MKIIIGKNSNLSTKTVLEEIFKNDPDIEICEKEDFVFVDFSSHMVTPFKIKETTKIMSVMEDKQKFKRYHYKKLTLKGRRS